MNIRYNEDGTVDFLERNEVQEDAYENGGLPELFFVDDCDDILIEAFYADQAWDILLETLHNITPTDPSTSHLINSLQFDILMQADITQMTDEQLEQWKQDLFVLLETSRDLQEGGTQDGIADQGDVGNNEHEAAYRRAMSIIS
jgi:hypothetical protein